MRLFDVRLLPAELLRFRRFFLADILNATGLKSPVGVLGNPPKAR
jgi:hypothetical protein